MHSFASRRGPLRTLYLYASRFLIISLIIKRMLILLGLVTMARAAMTEVETEEVYYLGDPQIGFSGNATIDANR